MIIKGLFVGTASDRTTFVTPLGGKRRGLGVGFYLDRTRMRLSIYPA